MTEQEWKASTDQLKMLEFLGDRASERKLRLFGCLCCRRVWHLIKSEVMRRTVEIAERYADGKASITELAAAYEDGCSAYRLEPDLVGGAAAETAAYWFGSRTEHTAQIAEWILRVKARWIIGLRKSDRREVTDLLRHLAGNPFRPYQPPPSWPSTVTTLAQSLYDQEPVHFALHDALLDSGHQELAEHFRES